MEDNVRIEKFLTCGDLVNFHPHLHALVTDGTFTPTRRLVAFPKIDLYALEHLFRRRVLRLLLRERRIDEALIRKLLGWGHSGFSLHNAVRIGSADSDGRRGVAEYILRSSFSLEKVRSKPCGLPRRIARPQNLSPRNAVVTRSAPSPVRAFASRPSRHPSDPEFALDSRGPCAQYSHPAAGALSPGAPRRRRERCGMAGGAIVAAPPKSKFLSPVSFTPPEGAPRP